VNHVARGDFVEQFLRVDWVRGVLHGIEERHRADRTASDGTTDFRIH
jgi:hypothetical protein